MSLYIIFFNKVIISLSGIQCNICFKQWLSITKSEDFTRKKRMVLVFVVHHVPQTPCGTSLISLQKWGKMAGSPQSYIELSRKSQVSMFQVHMHFTTAPILPCRDDNCTPIYSSTFVPWCTWASPVISKWRGQTLLCEGITTWIYLYVVSLILHKDLLKKANI